MRVDGGALSESKHILEFPSMTIWCHPSALANWTAQKMVDASAWSVEHKWCVLAQTITTSPLSSLATTAKAVEVELMAASTFSLIQLGKEGCQPQHGVGWGLSRGHGGDHSTLNSVNLWLIFFMDSTRLEGMLENMTWFLVFQISSRMNAIFKRMFQCFSRWSGAKRGSSSMLISSSNDKIACSSGLNPQQLANQIPLANGQFMNRWVEDSRAWLHNTHPRFWMTDLLIKFSYAVSALVPILHRSILMHFGALIF